MDGYIIVNKLSEEQLEQLMEMYKKEAWTKGRNPEDVKRMLGNSHIAAIIDTKSKGVIAFSRYLTDFVYRAFVYDVIVAKPYRGKGYGKMIMEYLLQQSPLKNVERVELSCIDHNVAFYEKLGFMKSAAGVNLMRRA